MGTLCIPEVNTNAMNDSAFEKVEALRECECGMQVDKRCQNYGPVVTTQRIVYPGSKSSSPSILPFNYYEQRYPSYDSSSVFWASPMPLLNPNDFALGYGCPYADPATCDVSVCNGSFGGYASYVQLGSGDENFSCAAPNPGTRHYHNNYGIPQTTVPSLSNSCTQVPRGQSKPCYTVYSSPYQPLLGSANFETAKKGSIHRDQIHSVLQSSCNQTQRTLSPIQPYKGSRTSPVSQLDGFPSNAGLVESVELSTEVRNQFSSPKGENLSGLKTKDERNEETKASECPLEPKIRRGHNHHYSASEDAFILKAKQSGMKYKDIKIQGGFELAEATLRGRYRTLTKPKSARVRRPKWKDEDLLLLHEGVALLREPPRRRLSPKTPKRNAIAKYSQEKIPWDRVAKYIVDNGGSYNFGNSTCCKKWKEIQATQE